jgi:hypothetical protein
MVFRRKLHNNNSSTGIQYLESATEKGALSLYPENERASKVAVKKDSFSSYLRMSTICL